MVLVDISQAPPVYDDEARQMRQASDEISAMTVIVLGVDKTVRAFKKIRHHHVDQVRVY